MTTPSRPLRRYTIDLDADLRRRAKIAAFEDDRPLSEIVRDLLEEWLYDRARARARAGAGATPAPAPKPAPAPVPAPLPAPSLGDGRVVRGTHRWHGTDPGTGFYDLVDAAAWDPATAEDGE